MLQDAGIKLTSVASGVLSMSGRNMIEALIAGERDTAVLAEMAIGRMRNKREALTEALSGHFGPHHAVTARQILDHIDFLDARIAAVSEQVAQRMVPFAAAVELLVAVPGISRISAEVVIAETGAGHGPVPEPSASGPRGRGSPPGNHESAGKRRRVGTTNGNRWLRRTLIESARAAARTKSSYFGAQYRQIARRRGPNKAAVAVAHSLVDVIWHLLSTGEPFQDLGADYYERRRDPRTRDTVAWSASSKTSATPSTSHQPPSPSNPRAFTSGLRPDLQIRAPTSTVNSHAFHRRRSSSATTPTAALSGTPKANRPGCRSTTSPTGPSASTPKPSLTESMTWLTTKAGSASVTSPTPPSSPSKQSDAGGTPSARTGSPPRPG